jgi:HSP20 family protein
MEVEPMLWTDPFVAFAPRPTRTAFLPATDVTVSDGDLVLTMDLPGLTSEDLSIELIDGHLAVRGERRRPELAHGTQRAHAERGFGRFERRIRLPEGVEPDRITASMDNGVLSLIVPKPERLVPRTIAIESVDHQRQLDAGAA